MTLYKLHILLICCFMLIISGCNNGDKDKDSANERKKDRTEQASKNNGKDTAKGDNRYTEGIDTLEKGAKQKKNKNQDISSLWTNMSSDVYPQTKAVEEQDARFGFEELNPGQGDNGGTQVQTDQGDSNQEKSQQPGIQQQTPPARQQPAQKQQTPPQQPAQQQPSPQQQTQPTQQPAGQQTNGQTAASDVYQIVQRAIELTNQQRRQNGLPPLQADTQLNGVAQTKAQDMQQNNYFSHTSPTYGSPFDMMRDMGVTYSAAGENIAQGQNTAEQVIQAWMNSEGHRKNILSTKYTHIGIGCETSGYNWSQMFIAK
ncbi:CAP domain-containing protein [Peribacillus sp. SCS-155]|uniref:CAP domain-containing protein n=1 Tax=Peribacillus sedimenti TaxID=3115297 RepID=UPI00390653BC